MSQKARDILDRIRGRFKRMMLRRRMRKKSEFGDWGNSGPMVPNRATDDHIADVAPDEVQTTAGGGGGEGEGGGGGLGGSRIIINEPAPNLNDVRIEYPEPYDLGTVRTSELAPNLNDVRIASFASNDLRTAVIAGHEPDPESEPEPEPEPEPGPQPRQREPATTTTRVPQVRFQEDHEASSEYSSLRDSEELIRGNMGTRPDVIKPLNINRENRPEEPYLSTHLGVPRTNAYQVSPGTERHSALSRTFNFDPTNIDRVDENITENPPVTHETVFPHVHEIREEQIYRDIHTYDHYHYVQPVYDLEVLPARHFAPAADGHLREVSARDLPECTGANQKWSIMENESVNAKRQAEIPRVIN